MLKTSLVLLAIPAALAADLHKVPEPIDGSYIAVFKKGISDAQRAQHMQRLRAVRNNATSVDREYHIGEDFNGYAAHFDQKALDQALASEELDFVEQDQLMKANSPACIQQQAATWGLVRTSERALKIDGDYKYYNQASGKDVTAYVIDTGIYLQHDEFKGGRATWGTNTVDNDNSDGNGHGTHCAGTIGGSTYGLAKDAKLVAVKVLNAEGSGSNAGVIDGVNWVATNHKAPAVGSLSLGGGKSTALNNAIDAATKMGVTMVVAAGNENSNACNVSPASASSAITVAASDNTDQRASFSNYGKCVDIYGPGVAITSAWINSPSSINTISGTSMACPHVSGEVAKYLSTDSKATPAMAKAFVTSEASEGLIKDGAIKDTPNLLLFADCSVFDDAFNYTKP